MKLHVIQAVFISVSMVAVGIFWWYIIGEEILVEDEGESNTWVMAPTFTLVTPVKFKKSTSTTVFKPTKILTAKTIKAPTPKGPCSPNPCQNGATCRVFRGREYVCRCRPDFSGKRCESRLEEIHVKREKLWKSTMAKLANQRRKQRFPDVIGIGVEKCGTSALINFLSFHPLIKTPPDEAHFFDNHYDRGVNWYLSLFPRVKDDEILMEKTPGYFNFLPVDIPYRIKKWVPNAKFILQLCEPVSRTYSDFVHEIALGELSSEWQFDDYVEKFLGEDGENLTKILDMTDSEAYRFITNLHGRNYPSHIFTTGLYYYHLLRWDKLFGLENLYIMSGDDLISQPGVEIAKLQKYLELPQLLLEEDFVRDNRTGFYCFDPKWSQNGKLTIGGYYHHDCLFSSEKGRTRNKRKNASNKTMETLRKYYKPFNEKLFRLLNKDFDWR